MLVVPKKYSIYLFAIIVWCIKIRNPDSIGTW